MVEGFDYEDVPTRIREIHRRNPPINWGRIGMIIAGLVVLVVIASGCEAYFNSTRDVTFKVNKTGQSCTSGKSCTNLVYTDHGTFKNSDSLIAGKFNSSDVTGALCPGGEYKVKVRGWRVGFLSQWPNILKIEQVVSPPPAGSGCTNN